MKKHKSITVSKRISKIITGFFCFTLVFILLISGIQEIIAENPVNDAVPKQAASIYRSDDLYYMNKINAVPVRISADGNITSIISKKPDISAQSAILINADSGDIIYELNPYKRLPMASTTKIMTAITAIESGVPLDKTFKITKEMTGAEGSSIYLYENERFSLTDLIYALLLNSANDSAEAIAVSIAGSIDKFADMMNEKAKELNLKDTNFTNPHGLDSELHYTTAYELAKIAAYALKNETFREIAGKQNHIIYPKNDDGSDNKSGARYLRNHNKMLRIYKNAIGVKTGFTKRSGRCLVSAAEREGTTLVAVTLNASNDWSDHAEMLDYGFANFHSVNLCVENEYKFDVIIVNGCIINSDGKKATVSIVKCANISAESASLPNHITTDKLTQKIELPRFIYAPVKKGDVIGRMIFTYDDIIIGCSVIAACEDIEAEFNNPKKPESLITRIWEFFKKLN